MANGVNDSHQCDNSHQELKYFICASSLDTYHSIMLTVFAPKKEKKATFLLNNRLINLAVPRSLGLFFLFSN